jgi:hypothetical protein
VRTKYEHHKRFELQAIDSMGNMIVIFSKSRNGAILKFEKSHERRGHHIVIIDHHLLEDKYYQPEIFRVGKDREWMKSQ